VLFIFSGNTPSLLVYHPNQAANDGPHKHVSLPLTEELKTPIRGEALGEHSFLSTGLSAAAPSLGAELEHCTNTPNVFNILRLARTMP